jgi:hypothetical protein
MGRSPYSLACLLATVLDGELLSAPTALEDRTSFRTPVGFAPQEEHLLPATTIDDDALRAIDEAFCLRQFSRDLLHEARSFPHNPPLGRSSCIDCGQEKHVHRPYGLFSEPPAAIVPSEERLPTRWVRGVCCPYKSTFRDSGLLGNPYVTATYAQIRTPCR